MDNETAAKKQRMTHEKRCGLGEGLAKHVVWRQLAQRLKQSLLNDNA
jgi:hypothetical protein